MVPVIVCLNDNKINNLLAIILLFLFRLTQCAILTDRLLDKSRFVLFWVNSKLKSYSHSILSFIQLETSHDTYDLKTPL